MRRKPGDPIIEIMLPCIDGTVFDSRQLSGKPYMLSFFRFASCPFCNLRMHELAKRFDELGDNFTIVAVFDSPLQNLQRHAEKHHAPFPVLADAENVYYRAYAIEHSFAGVVKGILTRLPSLMYAVLFKGYVPIVFKGSITTMPADFLVDAQGVIRTAYYGKDEGDHLSFEQVKAFAIDS